MANLPPNPALPTVEQMKTQAKRLRASMRENGTEMNHAAALETVARQWGFRDWNTAAANAPSTPPETRWQVGQRVRGTYLGNLFEGQIKAARTALGGYWHLTLVFDEAVDVVTSEHFSNFRKQVNCTINGQGITHQTTSDGTPHVVLRAA